MPNSPRCVVEGCGHFAHNPGMRSSPCLFAVLLLSGCTDAVIPSAPAARPAPPAPPPAARSPAPLPAPLPNPQPTPRPAAATSDWRDWPLTPGDWAYRQDARGSIALYGPRGADADFTIRCDRLAGQIFLSRKGAAVGTAPMTVRTSSSLRSLTSQPTGGTLAYMATALSPRDPLLDAMGFSRGRFVVEQPGLPTLVIPAWAELPRVVEDCRR